MLAKPNRHRGQQSKYKWGSMKIGDTFAVPASEAVKARQSAAQFKAKNFVWDYLSRTVEDGMVRFWRMPDKNPALDAKHPKKHTPILQDGKWRI